jgi:membrane-associated HD superfamily phosphohydrolase
MIEKLTLQDIIDRIDQVRERSGRLLGYRLIKDEELADAVAHLRTAFPEQVRNACALLEQRDALVADARRQSSRMIEEGQRSHDDLVADNEIVRSAVAEQERMMAEVVAARKTAERQADDYSLKMLEQLEQILTKLTETVRASETQFHVEDKGDETRTPETGH